MTVTMSRTMAAGIMDHFMFLAILLMNEKARLAIIYRPHLMRFQ